MSRAMRRTLMVTLSTLSTLSTLPFALGCSSNDDGEGDVESQSLALDERVTICHIPPTAPERARTTSVPASAVASHLAHGDTLGECGAQVCTGGSSVSCYSGPAGTEGVGACAAGTQTCASDGSGYGACEGEVTPSSEVCGNGVDDDCDGSADEGCLGDRAWLDSNADGLQDAGEPGVAGVTFLLRSSVGALVQVSVSSVAGAYYFSNVPPGQYYIEVVPPLGFGLTLDTAGDPELNSDFALAESGELRTRDLLFDGGTYFGADCGLVSIGSD